MSVVPSLSGSRPTSGRGTIGLLNSGESTTTLFIVVFCSSKTTGKLNLATGDRLAKPVTVEVSARLSLELRAGASRPAALVHDSLDTGNFK